MADTKSGSTGSGVVTGAGGAQQADITDMGKVGSVADCDQYNPGPKEYYGK